MGDDEEAECYQFYYIPLLELLKKNADENSEVTASLKFLERFMESFNEYQVFALTFPLEELEEFFG